MVYRFAECELDERLYQLRREGSPVALEPIVDGGTGKQIWAERYDRPPQDLFAVQEEVRRKIVVHLGLKLSADAQEEPPLGKL